MIGGIKLKLAKCHPERKVRSKELCGSCYDKLLKSANPDYRSRQIQNSSKWQKLNKEKRKEYNFKRRQREKNDPNKQLKNKTRWLKREYNITLEQYNLMFESQNRGCALCFRKPTKIGLHVDHCHKTGIIRGLLCHQCNWYLGTIDADPTIIDRIIKYRGI